MIAKKIAGPGDRSILAFDHNFKETAAGQVLLEKTIASGGKNGDDKAYMGKYTLTLNVKAL
jgi:hypothetical protein